MLTVLTWNILHGGGPARLPEITLALLEHRADVVVLSEYRERRGGSMRGVLADHGYSHQCRAHAGERRNGMLIASRFPIESGSCNERAPGEGRWLSCRVTGFDLEIAAVHVPDDSDLQSKKAFWEFLLGFARDRQGSKSLVIGDVNTGRRGIDAEGSCFRCEKQLRAFEQAGFRDAFRLKNPLAREFSWVSHQGRGFRIDAAYVSPPLHDVLQEAVYSQVERERGVSDHSLLKVSLALDSCQDVSQEPRFSGLFGPLGRAASA